MKARTRATLRVHPFVFRRRCGALESDQTLAFITNLSAGGAALYVGQEIPSSSIQTIEFSLPGEKENLTAVVELIWRDVQGRMGIRFANVSAGVSESVEKWSAAHSQAQAKAKAAGT